MRLRGGRRPPALSDNPRLVAWRALEEVRRGRTPEDALGGLWALLPPRDRRLASALVYETVRHRRRLDRVLAGRLGPGTGPGVMTALRIGLVQLLVLDRAAPHAAVDETVRLAKTVAPGRDKLVNAVLRGLSRERDAAREAGLPWPGEPAGPDCPPERRLGVLYSHPDWLVDDLVRRLGFRGARAALAAGNRPVPPTIRVNPLKTGREALAVALPFEVRPTAFSPWGLVPLGPQGPPEAWPGFAGGLFAIQDEASQILGLLAGDFGRALDACAGLGGKTLALAALRPGAEVVAVDRDGSRLGALRSEALRLGLPSVPKTIPAELGSLPPEAVGGPFPLVVLDAPCSGLGVARRRPDLKWARGPGDVEALAGLQRTLLGAAARHVAPGGRLIYAVCTFTEAEGPDVMDWFYRSDDRFRPWTLGEIPPVLRPLAARPGELGLWPHLHGTDGFFYGLAARKDG